VADELSGADEVLEERAQALAAVPPAPAEGETLAVLLVRLGAGQYALDMAVLRSIQRVDGLTPVPNVPAFVAGILNVRGEMVTVLDLAVALGVAKSNPSDPASETPPQVVLVDAPQGRVGLLVDEVLGTQAVALELLDRAFSGHDFARGIAAGRFVPLNLEQLLTNDRFSVFEEVT
jgi:purine-binding chemotaxis protein CheW